MDVFAENQHNKFTTIGADFVADLLLILLQISPWIFLQWEEANSTQKSADKPFLWTLVQILPSAMLDNVEKSKVAGYTYQ